MFTVTEAELDSVIPSSETEAGGGMGVAVKVQGHGGAEVMVAGLGRLDEMIYTN